MWGQGLLRPTRHRINDGRQLIVLSSSRAFRGIRAARRGNGNEATAAAVLYDDKTHLSRRSPLFAAFILAGKTHAFSERDPCLAPARAWEVDKFFSDSQAPCIAVAGRTYRLHCRCWDDISSRSRIDQNLHRALLLYSRRPLVGPESCKTLQIATHEKPCPVIRTAPPPHSCTQCMSCITPPSLSPSHSHSL